MEEVLYFKKEKILLVKWSKYCVSKRKNMYCIGYGETTVSDMEKVLYTRVCNNESTVNLASSWAEYAASHGYVEGLW